MNGGVSQASSVEVSRRFAEPPTQKPKFDVDGSRFSTRTLHERLKVTQKYRYRLHRYQSRFRNDDSHILRPRDVVK